jgi:predicted membrane-bound spermidine synthase
MMDMSMEQRLKLQVFLCGAVVMALELTASRILAPYFGNSIFVWGSLIGVVLTGMSAGYYIGGRVADKRPDFGTFCLVVLTAGIFVLLIPLVTPVVFDLIISLNLGERISPLIASVAILAMPSFLLGMVSPYAIRLAAKTLSDLGNLAGKLYSLSTAGSIFGTFVTAFILIPESFNFRASYLSGFHFLDSKERFEWHWYCFWSYRRFWLHLPR